MHYRLIAEYTVPTAHEDHVGYKCLKRMAINGQLVLWIKLSTLYVIKTSNKGSFTIFTEIPENTSLNNYTKGATKQRTETWTHSFSGKKQILKDRCLLLLAWICQCCASRASLTSFAKASIRDFDESNPNIPVCWVILLKMAAAEGWKRIADET